MTLLAGKKTGVISGIMVAACIAAGFGFGGCERQLSTGQQAQKQAQEAARRAASAGNPRATDEFVSAAASAGAETGALAAELKSLPAKYVVTNSVDEDLTKAIAELRQAVGADVGDADKSAFNYSLGLANMDLAGSRLSALDDLSPAIASKCLMISSLAQSSLDLSTEADNLEAWLKKNPPSRSELTKASDAATAAKNAVDQKQKELNDVQTQITAKQSQARQIYGATDTAFAAADKLKGKEAIEAGNKAMADRKQADVLMQEIANLDPKLSQLKGELDILTVRAKDSESLKAMAESAYKLATDGDKQVNEQVAALRKSANEIVTGTGGVADQLKSLRDMTAAKDKTPDLAARIEQAAKAAADAAQAFGAAGSAYSSYVSYLRERTEGQELAPSDPLQSTMNDKRMAALLNWSKAAAMQQEARADLTGAQLAGTIDRAVKVASTASEKLGLKAEAPTAINSADLLGKAKEKFKAAAEAADAGLNGLNGKDAEAIKWIGYTVKATAKHGEYLAGDKAALGEAQTAKKAAVDNNAKSADQLSWIE